MFGLLEILKLTESVMGKVIFFPESLLEEDWVRQGASIIIKIILGMLKQQMQSKTTG